ncbi:MAG: hypothetical protein IJJ47_04775 [Methanosphaera sp.]|nr:hypothetical protein [Methanosphaera sp.]
MESIEKINNNYLWDLPQYFQIKENKLYEQKLINVMMKGFIISRNLAYLKIKFTQEEEGLIEDYKGMLNYVLNLESSRINIEFIYNLMYEYFEFMDKKIEFIKKLIEKKEYESFKDRYSQILEEQGDYFENNIFIEDFEESKYFRGYDNQITTELLDTDDGDYVHINLEDYK